MVRKRRKKDKRTLENTENENKVVAVLEEMLRWIKVTSISHVKQLLEGLPPEEKIAYQYSDGRSSREVAKMVNVHHGTIVVWWKKWYTLGIAETMHVRRGIRYKRVFSLFDFDIDIPKIPTQEAEQKEELESGKGSK